MFAKRNHCRVDSTVDSTGPLNYKLLAVKKTKEKVNIVQGWKYGNQEIELGAKFEL